MTGSGRDHVNLNTSWAPPDAHVTHEWGADAPDRVDVYCDLRRRCASVRALRGSNKGKVVAKPHTIVLEDVRFRIQPSGQLRTRLEGRRNVHAFARGWLRSVARAAEVLESPERVMVRYNPFVHDRFVRADTGQRVDHARWLVVVGKEAFVLL